MGEKNTSEAKLQEKYLLFQAYQQNIEELKNRVTLIDGTIAEIDNTISSLDEFDKAEDGERECLVPVGSGCYMFGKLTELKKVLVNVGSGVLLKKDIKDAKGILLRRREELGRARDEILEQITKIAEAVNKLGMEIQGMSRREG